MIAPVGTRLLSKTVCAAISLSVFLAACTGGTDGSAPQPSEGPLVVNAAIDQTQADRLTSRFNGLDQQQREAEIARRDSAVERELWTLSGLEAAVGGPAKADAIFADLSRSVAAQVAASRARPMKFRPASYSAANTGEALGAGIFGGMLLAGPGAIGGVQATNDDTNLTGTLTAGFTISSGKDGVRVEFTGTHESQGVELKLKTRSEVQPCPGADGKVELKALIDVWASVKGGRDGSRATVDVSMNGEVDDNAKLALKEIGYRVQYSKTVGTAGAFVDASVTLGGPSKVNRTGGTVSDTFTDEAVAVGHLVAMVLAGQLSEAAQAGLESGRCVKLQTSVSDGPSGLEPNASVTIMAAPRSKLDGAKAGGTVTANLTGGAASVDPGSKVPADATFTYKAPGEKDKTGTVELEARSRRGVGKASITFDTKPAAYQASGGTEVQASGTVADLAKPFTLRGVGAGFTVTFTYTPTSARGGTVRYAGSGAGFTMKGSGNYKITGSDPDPLTLKQTAYGCVNVGGCRTTTDVFTLTRTSG